MVAETMTTLESMSDADLMAAVVRREADAIQEIYSRYESTLRAVVQSVLHEDGETDDAKEIMRSLRSSPWEPAGT